MSCWSLARVSILSSGFGQAPRFAEDVKMIQVDIADEEIGGNRAVDVGIVGDAKMVLRQLMDEGSDSFRGRAELAWIDTLLWLRKALPRKDGSRDERGIFAYAIRSGCAKRSATLWIGMPLLSSMDTRFSTFARQSVPTHAPGHRVNAGPNGCMVVAVPFGLGAKVAKPDTQVIVLSGDGSFGMNGMGNRHYGT